MYEKASGFSSDKFWFSLWFNTGFIEGEFVEFTKADLDRGLKDKRLDQQFKLEVHFEQDKERQAKQQDTQKYPITRQRRSKKKSGQATTHDMLLDKYPSLRNL